MQIKSVARGDCSVTQNVAVLLHGFLGNKEVMLDALPHLEKTCGRVISFDLPFHGESNDVQVSSLGEAAKLIAEGIKAHKVESCILVGYSLGGRMALAIAQLAGSLWVEALVLLSADPGADPDSDNQLRRKLDGERSRRITEDFDGFLRRWYEAPLWGTSLSADERAQWRQRIQSDNKAEQMARAIRVFSPADVPSSWEFLCGPRCVPTLLVCGCEDEKYGEIVRRYIASARSDASHVGCLVPGAGHQVLLQKQQESERVITNFLAVHLANRSLVLDSLEFKEFSLPLTGDLVVGNRAATVSRRHGVLLALRSGELQGCGEACPLPGCHEETLKDVVDGLRKLRNVFPERETCRALDLLDAVSGPATLCFAVETACVQLLAAKCGVNMDDILVGLTGHIPMAGAPPLVKINAVVPRSTAGRAGVEALLREGYSTVKYKVGDGSVSDEVRSVNQLCRTMRAHGGVLRLDANQSWSLDEAIQFARGLEDPEVIEYIEEPLSEPSLLGPFHRQSGLRIALDESIGGDHWTHLRAEDGLSAYVVKPTVLGGVLASLRMLSKGDPRAKIIVSSTFDSGFALSYLSLMGSVLSADRAHGLGTFTALARDLTEPGFSDIVAEGSVSLSGCRAQLQRVRDEGYPRLLCR